MTQEQNTEKKYPIGGYAPGYYQCRCVTCKQDFMGDKRAVQCEPCAEKSVAAQPKEQNTDVQQTEVYQKFKRALNIQHDMRPGPNPFVVDCIKIAEDYHASKLKELSEKGEPKLLTAIGQTIKEYGLATYKDNGECKEYKDLTDDDTKEIASEIISGLSPVIALLHHDIAWAKAEKKQKDEEIASLRAQLDEAILNAKKICHELDGEPDEHNALIARQHAAAIAYGTKGGKAHE